MPSAAFIGRARGIDGAGVAAVWEAGELIRDPYSGVRDGRSGVDPLQSLGFRPAPGGELPAPQIRDVTHGSRPARV